MRAIVGVMIAAGVARAQTGVLDQVSPLQVSIPQEARFDLSNAAVVWRAQVRAGISGRLEGVRIRIGGSSTATAAMRLRPGSAESPGSVLSTAQLVRTAAGPETVFIDLVGAGLDLSAGQTFVLEFQGNWSGMTILGSYVIPPLYPEPLYVNGASFDDGNYRIGFETFMLTGNVCEADLTGSSDPNDAAYGVRDGVVDAGDFFYYLDQFIASNLDVADLTGSSDPNDAAYGIADGVIDAADFFYYLDLFASGC